MRVYQDNDRGVYGNTESDCYQLEDAAQINTFRQVHRQLLQERQEKTDGVSHVYVLYQLRNGVQVKRYYTIDEHTAAYDTLRTYFSDYRYIFNANSWQEVKERFTSVEISLGEELYYPQDSDTTEEWLGEDVKAIDMYNWNITDPVKLDAFLEAVRKDCMAGNMAQAHTFHVGEDYAAWCYLGSNVLGQQGKIIANGQYWRDLSVYNSAENVVQLLRQWLAEKQ